MKCDTCVDNLIAIAKKNADPQQALSELQNAIKALPDAITATRFGPKCLYHYLEMTEMFKSGISKLLEIGK